MRALERTPSGARRSGALARHLVERPAHQHQRLIQLGDGHIERGAKAQAASTAAQDDGTQLVHRLGDRVAGGAVREIDRAHEPEAARVAHQLRPLGGDPLEAGAQVCAGRGRVLDQLEILAAGRGVFLLGAHMGSFEVARAIGRQQPGLKVAMVMYEGNARKLNEALAAINPAAVQEIIPLGKIDSMLRVQSSLDAGVALGVLSDRTLSGDPTLRIPFLGADAEFPIGPMRLAAMLKRPVLFMSGLYLGGNRYAIHFERLADFSSLERAGRDAAVHTAVTAYAACLERHCRAAPYNWFNFFDFWHPKDAA